MPLTCKALTIMKPRTCVLIHVTFSYKTTTSAHPPSVKLEQVLLWLALFMLCNMALTFTFVHEILKFKSSWAALSCGTVYYAAQGGSNFWLCGWNPRVTIQVKATEQHFPVVLFLLLYEVLLTCGSVDENLGCNHSKESNRGAFFCYTIYYADCARWF